MMLSLQKHITIIFIFITSLLQAQVPSIDCVQAGVANPTITWTEDNSGCNQYAIYVSIDGGPFTILNTITAGTTNSQVYTATDGTSHVLSFYMACTNNPLNTSDTINNQRMINPEIKSVSLINNNTVQIQWNQSISPNTGFYRVYESVNGSALATQRGADINGIASTSQIHTYPSNISSPLTYTVTALDKCLGNENLPTAPTGYHSSIFMDIKTDRCASALNISWTPYIGWDAVDYYLIEAINTTDNSTFRDTISKDSSSYRLENVTDANNYNIHVSAHHQNGNYSASNDSIININVVALPKFTYLANTSVHDNGVHLNFYVDNSADIKEFEIHRAQIGGQFSQIWSQKVDLPAGVNENDLMARLSVASSYIDRNALKDDIAYNYKIIAIDSCQQSHESNIGTSMLLEGNADYEYVNELYWPSYKDWTNGVSDYEILSQIDTQTNWYNIINVTDTFYNHDIEAQTRDESTRDYDGVFCYQIKAKTSPSPRDNAYGIDSIVSKSNKLCLVQWPPFLSAIPNAFTPLEPEDFDGDPCQLDSDYQNDCFGPNMVFIQNQGYYFAVFDRNGQQVFETSDPKQKWDGLFHPKNGPATHPMPSGTYVYLLRFKLPKPDNPSLMIDKELKSIFMLLR